MTTFALIKDKVVKDGKLHFYKLIINSKCHYDAFCREVERNSKDYTSLKKIYTYMNILAEADMLLPATKFRPIKENDRLNIYEFKHGNIRVYVIKETPDVFILLGGYKKGQKQDIEKCIRIAKEYKIQYTL